MATRKVKREGPRATPGVTTQRGEGGRRGQLRKNKVKVLNHDPIFWLLKMNKKEYPHPNLAKMFKGNKRTVQ